MSVLGFVKSTAFVVVLGVTAVVLLVAIVVVCFYCRRSEYQIACSTETYKLCVLKE